MQRFEPLPYQFETRLACEITGAARGWLNDAINAKDGYKCAPKTTQGKPRLYKEHDLVALFLFRFLTDLGYSQALASMYACEVKDALTSKYHELPEVFEFPTNPFPDQCVARSASAPTLFTAPVQNTPDRTYVAWASLCINVIEVRAEVRRRMELVAERERNTFGLPKDEED